MDFESDSVSGEILIKIFIPLKEFSYQFTLIFFFYFNPKFIKNTEHGELLGEINYKKETAPRVTQLSCNCRLLTETTCAAKLTTVMERNIFLLYVKYLIPTLFLAMQKNTCQQIKKKVYFCYIFTRITNKMPLDETAAKII